MVSDADVQQFKRTWSGPTGIGKWLAEVNNQALGRRFMYVSLSFFLIGGVLALIMRIQLTVSDNTFLGPHVYNQLFTMHGSTMMYLFAVPFLEGLALYILPLMLGSRDVAFPRLTAFSFWTYVFGGLIFYSSFLVGAVPDAGWFSYTPLSGPKYSGLGVDFWLLGLSLVELGGITAGIEIVVTILRLRAPGMSLNRIPLFAWALLVAGTMIIFAFTTLLMATVLLELDRTAGTRFFDATAGGNSLLWQHLFWFFGHPEVYIIFIPATGVVSMIVTTFARRIVGYTLIAVAIIVTGFVSFGLWVHHMYTTGLPELSMSFFAAASLMIAAASGTQVFSWIASLWGRRPALKTPLVYVLGFVFIFVLGGMTGVMIAIVPFDWQVHDTYFIVAHFHYVLIGGAVFPIFAGLHYWAPKISGRMLNERLGLASFWLTFLGFNSTFFPMHIMGFLGLPRRVYTYPASLGLDGMNVLATVGAFMLGLGFLLFFVNYFRSLRVGEPATANPWGGDSLEWSVDSPPPVYSFYHPPWVEGLHPLWDQKEEQPISRAQLAMTAAPHEWRATLSTDPLMADPQGIQYLPGPTYVPFAVAVGTAVGAIGLLAKLFFVAAIGAVFTIGGLVLWLWPDEDVIAMLRASKMPEQAGLPIFTTGSLSTAWWGMVGVIATLGTAFGTLLYSYFYLRLYSIEWPQGDIAPPGLLVPALIYLLLIASGGVQFFAFRAFRQDKKRPAQILLATAAALGVVFLVLECLQISRLGFMPQENAYASVFYVLSVMLCIAVPPGLLLQLATQMRLQREWSRRDNYSTLQLELTTLYWYFLAAMAAAVYLTLYVSPHVI